MPEALLFASFKGIFRALSTKGISRLSSDERASIKIPENIKEILIGIILGDAHISRRSPTANSRLVYTQTSIKHKEYFDYVFSFFSPFCVKDYIPQSKIVRDNRTKKIYSAISFTTMQLLCFNEFRLLFFVLRSYAQIKRKLSLKT